MRYQPTETELKKMGFVEDDFFVKSYKYKLLNYYPKNDLFSLKGVTIYPTSKSDIQCLIKLLTP